MSSQSFASELVANLVARGVKHFYLSPGSRSQALALAAYALEEAGVAELTVRLDERSMAFTALGRALAIDGPVAIITTSGTAVANLHPAVLEAHHSGVPLILLTADRPANLRGKGANQTTNQVGIFSDAVRLCIDADASFNAAELAQLAVETAVTKFGPVQLNLQLSEPLSAADTGAAEIYKSLTPTNSPDIHQEQKSITLENAASTVVIAGAGAGKEAANFAEKYSLPLFAEPSSGARNSANCILRYSELLQQQIAKEITQVVVFGKPTLNRAITKLITNCQDVQVVENKKFGRFDVANNAKNFADAFSFEFAAPANWLNSWKENDAKLEKPTSFSRADIVRAIWDCSTENDAILLGASKLAREADSFASVKDLAVYSNRGLAGIDGTNSTAIGIAQATKGVTRALLGDLTVLHDIGGLNLTGIQGLNLQLIVVNDKGGKIFDQLEVRDTTSDTAFQKLFRTPQHFDLEALAKGFGWNYMRVNDEAALRETLSASGCVIIEILMD